MIQAATGLPDAFRRFGGVPLFAPTLMADKVSGLTIAYAVLAALFHRERTGEGQQLEVPMVDVMTAFMLVEHAGAATARPPQGPSGYQRILNSERRPQRTSDGWISVLPYTERNFADIFRAGGGRTWRLTSASAAPGPGSTTPTTSIARWPRSSSGARRPSGWPSARPPTCQLRPSPPSTSWSTTCAEDDHPVAGRYKVIPQPVRFSRMSGPTVRRPAALSGQHTDEVLAEVRAAGPDAVRRPIGRRPSDGGTG